MKRSLPREGYFGGEEQEAKEASGNGRKNEGKRERAMEKTMQRILITGGTGTLGRQVTTQLREAGYQIRLMSRGPAPSTVSPGTEWVRADLETGQGLAAAVQGVDIIVHTASSPLWHSQQVDVDG